MFAVELHALTRRCWPIAPKQVSLEEPNHETGSAVFGQALAGDAR